MTGLVIVGAWLALLAIVFGGYLRPTLPRLWRESVLRVPVLIFESDDWGPGPASDADALQCLERVLARHRDSGGKSAVMTLGLLLAVPDTKRIREAGGGSYVRVALSEPPFAPVLDAILHGSAAGVFSPQLHGMEHYWPDSVMKAGRQDEEVRAWLVQDGIPRTEDLPPPLQSRWIDASELPANPLSDADIRSAATEEAAVFSRIFGTTPVVVVPPTFVWNEAAEAGWVKAGVRFVVTPGTRYSGRDRHGALTGTGARLHNGETGDTGVTYIVRDDYFEPALGHRAERALAAMHTKTRAGRPTLLETHRFNFTGSTAQRDAAAAELDRVLCLAVERFPDVRFLSTAELATAMSRADPHLIERRLLPRLPAWMFRLAQVPRVRKIAWITGAMIPAWLIYHGVKAVGPRHSRGAPEPGGRK